MKRILNRLSPGEQTCLCLLVDFYTLHKRFPSLREQSKQAGYTFQAASNYRNLLSRKGWITLAPDGTISTVTQPWENYRILGEATLTGVS